jgi:peptidoglycan/xylan/chitin deacetylase (PgdA/CDA1 family)
MYHHLEPDHPARTPYAISVRQFEDQLDVLQRAGFTTINFEQLSKARRSGEALSGKSVVITFDDGYVSFLDYAVPALQVRGMSATAFLVVGEIGGFNRWDESEGIPRRALMSEANVEGLIAAGFEIGSHGWAHRDLVACSPKELEEEIGRSRQALHAKFGIVTTTFAYPYGRYSETHYKSLASAGFQAAVTSSSTTPGIGNQFALRRVNVQQRDNRLTFFLKLSPLYLRYKAWRCSAFGWRH